jgi:hypothetical protein
MRCGCGAGHSSGTGSRPLPIILTLRQGSGDGRHWKLRQEKSGQGRLKGRFKGRFKGREASLFIMSRPTTTRIDLFVAAIHGACRCSRA